MRKYYTYDEARQAMVSGLLRDVTAHESGDFWAIGAEFDTVDNLLPRESGAEWTKLFIALNFWDSWIDSRNHEWMFYEGIGRDDWPTLAKLIITFLRNNEDIDNKFILESFDFKPRKTILGKIKEFFQKD